MLYYILVLFWSYSTIVFILIFHHSFDSDQLVTSQVCLSRIFSIIMYNTNSINQQANKQMNKQTNIRTDIMNIWSFTWYSIST